MRVALNPAQYAQGADGICRSGRGIPWEVVADMLIPSGDDAILAVFATPNFDN